MIYQMVEVKWRYYATVINYETKKQKKRKYENIKKNNENMNTI